jgi:glycosyltransferase involved in cell wall biosynthesis
MFCPGWPTRTFQSGVSSYVASVRPALRALGHDVTVLARTVKSEAPEEGVVDIGAHRDSRREIRGIVDNVCFRLAPRTAKRLQTLRIHAAAVGTAAAARPLDVVEIEEAFGVARGLRRATGVPVCVRLHGPWFLVGPAVGAADDAEFRHRVREEGRALAAADLVTAPAKDVLERTRAHYGIPLDRAAIVPNPIEPVAAPDRWRLDACDRGRILFVGRFERIKGADLAVLAFARILREFPEARLTIAGPDTGLEDDAGRRWTLREYVEHVLPGALEAARVEWVGQVPRSDVAALRRRAMVSIVPSRYETFPYTLTEALAAGCPVVASRTGGIPELVSDEENGFLHREGEAEHLAERVAQVLRHPEHAAALGARAALDCERRLAPEVVASRLADAYRSVLRPAAAHGDGPFA